MDPLSKRPVGDLTGYIVCVYRVFKGDDGEKFERNWLYWTGKMGSSNSAHSTLLPTLLYSPWRKIKSKILQKSKVVNLRCQRVGQYCNQSWVGNVSVNDVTSLVVYE